MRVTVVTRPENGWDCVYGVYKTSREETIKIIMEEEENTLQEVEEAFAFFDRELVG